VQAFVTGVVAGFGIAVPIGAVGTYLVVLGARSGLRVAVPAALGVASADLVYAAVAMLAGTALAAPAAAVAGPLRWAAFVVLLLLAAWIAVAAVREHRSPQVAPVRRPVGGPSRAYGLLLGITLLNPTTIVYFAALVVGGRGADLVGADRVLFVLGAFLASAAWQLSLAGGGAAVGRAVTGPRGRLVSGLASAATVAALAAWTVAR
jgi:arginine exporter protein ArgO